MWPFHPLHISHAFFSPQRNRSNSTILSLVSPHSNVFQGLFAPFISGISNENTVGWLSPLFWLWPVYYVAPPLPSLYSKYVMLVIYIEYAINPDHSFHFSHMDSRYPVHLICSNFTMDSEFHLVSLICPSSLSIPLWIVFLEADLLVLPPDRALGKPTIFAYSHTVYKNAQPGRAFLQVNLTP